MPLRYLATLSICVGVLLLVGGVALPHISPSMFVAEQAVEEYSAAAEALHSASSEPGGENPVSRMQDARREFQAAKEKVELARSRRKSLKWLLNTGGFALILVGGLLHLVLANPDG